MTAPKLTPELLAQIRARHTFEGVTCCDDVQALLAALDEAAAVMVEQDRRLKIVTCAFCGEQYPRGTPAHTADVLAEHIVKCERHPMKAMADRNALLEAAALAVKRYLMCGSLVDADIADREHRPRVIAALDAAGFFPAPEAKS